MKVTMELPDETVLVTVSIATQETPTTINLGVFPITSVDLKDGNTVDFKTSHDSMKKKYTGSEENDGQTY